MKIQNLEDQLAATSSTSSDSASAIDERDRQVVRLEVELAEAIVNNAADDSEELLAERAEQITKLDQLLAQTEEEKNAEISRLDERLVTELASLQESLLEADERREVEVSRLEDELDAARANENVDMDEAAAEAIAARDAKIVQKNKKLKFIGEQLEQRDSRVVELQETSAELETELAGLRKILARKKSAAPAPAAGADLSAIQPQLDGLDAAISKLDSHLAGGVDEWKQLELNIGGAVSLLIRATSKDPALQRIVNPILEELQSGLERGRSIVKGGQQLVSEERKSLKTLTDAVSGK